MKKQIKLLLALLVIGTLGILLILGTWLYGSYNERMHLFLATAEQSLYVAIQETIVQNQKLAYGKYSNEVMSPTSHFPLEFSKKITERFPQISNKELKQLYDSLYNHELENKISVRGVPAVSATMLTKEEAEEMNYQPSGMLWKEIPPRRIAVPLYGFLGELSDPASLKQIEKWFQNELISKGINIEYDLKVVSAKQDSTLFNELKFYPTKASSSDAGAISEVAAEDDPYNREFITVEFKNPLQYVFYSLSWQLIISLILVWIMIGSFVYLFHTLLKQNRLDMLRKAFVNNLTHELRTPVTTVSVALQALNSTIGNKKDQLSYHNVASEELDRLSTMIDKVLQIAEDDLLMNRPLEFEEYNVIELIEKCISSARLNTNQDNVRFYFSPSSKIEVIIGDSHHMRNVIGNLLENAVKYGAKEIHIFIQIKKGDFFTLSIQDDGVGIEPAYQQQVFEPFFRVPQGDLYTVKGFGLGLAYVHQIVHQHGGTIKLKSVLHEGSTFTITIPKKMKK